MKKSMMSIVLLLVMGALSSATGQEKLPLEATYNEFAELKSYQDCDIGMYAKHFLFSLEYAECDEIVESALAQIAMLKLAQPMCKNKMIKDKVDDLTINGKTAAVRFKAYITSMVFQNPGMFMYETYGNYQTGDALFLTLSRKLQHETLAANDIN